MTDAGPAVGHRPRRGRRRGARLERRHDRRQRAGRRAVPAAAPDRSRRRACWRRDPAAGDRHARDADRQPRGVPRPERGQGGHGARRRRRCISAARRSPGRATARRRAREPARVRRRAAPRRLVRLSRRRAARITRLPPSALEQREKLEQLRALETWRAHRGRRLRRSPRRPASIPQPTCERARRKAAAMLVRRRAGASNDERSHSHGVRAHHHAVEAGRLPRRGAVRRPLVRADVLLAQARAGRWCRRCSG